MEYQNHELHARLLEMLAWFHQFCTSHQLRYYILGGTMLGAVRHGGFIPWDDDIDVGMPWEDHLRFRQLIRDHPHDPYILESPDSDQPDFFYTFAKLYDTRTTLVENTRIPVKRGIYLDIFILAGVGDTKSESIAFFRPIKRRTQLLLAMTAGFRKERKFYKNAAVLLARCIPRRLMDPRQLLMDIQRRYSGKSFYQCSWVATFGGPYREREILPRAVFGDPTVYLFENLRVYGVSDYETYLTALYGNWRELPPVEKRKPHHDYLYCNLHKSYLKES